MKRWLPSLLVFAVVSAAGTLWWEVGGRQQYGGLVMRVGGALFEWIGLEPRSLAPRERFINLVVFVALMAATPGIALRRRAYGTALGLAALFVSHLALSALVWSLAGGLTSFPLFIAIFSDVLPFALWLAIARDAVSTWVGSGAEPPDDA